jgi:hypothetical protein
MEYWLDMPQVYTLMYIDATRPPNTRVQPTAAGAILSRRG